MTSDERKPNLVRVME